MHKTVLLLLVVAACSPSRERVAVKFSLASMSRFAQSIDLDLTLMVACAGDAAVALPVTRGTDGLTFTAKAPPCGEAMLYLGLWRVVDDDRIAAAAASAAVTLANEPVDVEFLAGALGEVDIISETTCEASIDDASAVSLTAGKTKRLALAVGEHVIACPNGVKARFSTRFAERLSLSFSGRGVTSLTATVLDRVDVRLDWAGNGDSYQVRLGTTPAVSSEGVLGATGVTGTSHVLTNLADLTTYYVAVQSLDADGNVTDTSDTISFATLDARPAVLSTDLPMELPNGTASVTALVQFSEAVTIASAAPAFTVDNGASVADYTTVDNVSWAVLLTGLQTEGRYNLGIAPAQIVSVAHGRAARPFSRTFSVAPFRLYVSQANGNDANAGTSPTTAFANVERALSQLPTLRGSPTNQSEVWVAAGTFNLASPLIIPAFTRVLGGFADDFAGVRDPKVHISALNNGFSGSPLMALNDPAATPINTVIDGLRVDGGMPILAAVAIDITAGSPAVRGMKIIAGVSTMGADCVGLQVTNASPEIRGNNMSAPPATQCGGFNRVIWFKTGSGGLIADNLVDGHDMADSVSAMVVEGTLPTAVRNNFIDTGDSISLVGQRTGVSVAGGDTLIYGNVIRAGAGSFSVGVDIGYDRSAKVINNVIDFGDAGSDMTGVRLNGASGPVNSLIANNVLYHRGGVSGAYGVREVTSGSDAIILNNVFTIDTQAGGGLYVNSSFVSFTTATALNFDANHAANLVAPTGASAVFVTYPYSAGSTGHTAQELTTFDFHLIDPSFFSAGLDASADVGLGALDLAGAPRSVPWCIGVYEQ